MPRTKGARNKNQGTVEEKIAALEQELSVLREQVSAKEAELKTLQDMKNEELVHSLLDAIAGSGKTIQEVIDMVKCELPGELKIDG